MTRNIIKSYAEKLEVKDIIKFGLKEGIYSILSGLAFPESRLNLMKEDITKVQDNLVKRLEISQTQKIDSVDWKIVIPKIDNQLNKS